MYVVVLFEVPAVVRSAHGEDWGAHRDPSSPIPAGIYPLANRREDPIRMRAELHDEWGLEPSVEYAMQNQDRIPIWPWNWDEQDFYAVNPVTGGAPIPGGFIHRDGDHFNMQRTWRLESGRWVMRG
jgi:hypothetical protein